jgi:hypothetical protein
MVCLTAPAQRTDPTCGTARICGLSRNRRHVGIPLRLPDDGSVRLFTSDGRLRTAFSRYSAVALGAHRVIAVDHFPHRLDLAKSMGAEVINFEEVDVREALVEMTGGIGPDACIDAVGMESHGVTADSVTALIAQTCDRSSHAVPCGTRIFQQQGRERDRENSECTFGTRPANCCSRSFSL